MKKNVIYREHRGGLDEAMKTQKKFDNLNNLLFYLTQKYKCDIYDLNIQVYYKYTDERINWPITYIISLKNKILGMFTILY